MFMYPTVSSEYIGIHVRIQQDTNICVYPPSNASGYTGYVQKGAEVLAPTITLWKHVTVLMTKDFEKRTR